MATCHMPFYAQVEEVLASNILAARSRRIRFADNLPLWFDETYLPKELGEKVVQDDLETQPIFSLLEEKYDAPLTAAEYRLAATSADSVVTDALGINCRQPDLFDREDLLRRRSTSSRL